MGKYLRRFNGKEWVTITTPSEALNPSNDTQVIVTNNNYAIDSATTLDETLDVINNDITRLQQNVAWLAKHGGGGSGIGGGSSTTSAEISIMGTGFNVTNGGTAYVQYDEENPQLQFKLSIIKASSTDAFTYSIEWDNKKVTEGILKGGASTPITIKGINTSTTTHILRITATNNDDGFLLPVFQCTIIEQSLYVSGEASQNIIKSNENASVKFKVTSSFKNTDVTVIVKTNSNGDGKTYNFKTSNVEKNEKEITSIWKDIYEGGGESGYSYKVEVFAYVEVGGQQIKSNTFVIWANIVNSDELNISINKGALPKTIFDNDANIDDIPHSVMDEKNSFIFTFSKRGANNIYYAVKISNYGEDKTFTTEPLSEKLIIGEYFDETLNNGDEYNYRNNKQISGSISDPLSFTFPSSEYQIFKGYNIITVKAWINETENKTVEGVFYLDMSSGYMFPYQIPDRFEMGTSTRDTLYARWDRDFFNRGSNSSTLNSIQWYYSPIGESKNVEIPMTLINTNGKVNGIVADTLRFQSNAYGIINLKTPLINKSELQSWTDDTYDSCNGFTLSITFKSDVMPDNTSTILRWGDEDNFYIEVTSKVAKWRWYGYEINVNITEEKVNTLDFVYSKETKNIKIFLNGIVTQVVKVSNTSDAVLSNNIYLGCNEKRTNLCEVTFYDISLFSTALNTEEIVINGFNNRVYAENSSADIESAYRSWRDNNLFYTDKENEDADNTIPSNHIFQDGKYITKSTTMFADIKGIATIPIVLIKAAKGLSSDYFYKTSTEEDLISGGVDGCILSYYDPKTGKTIEIENVNVNLQGTSTLTYPVKNLEIILPLLTNGKRLLFQPKKSWFPEYEFTLKADVMDSAHANNATIGTWINQHSSNIMDKTPAQRINEIYAPYVYDNRGTPVYDVENNTPLRHNEPKPKVAIEGFPIILIVQFFEGDQLSNDQTMLGIYSFNLGRKSHYNNGVKFLKGYCQDKSILPTTVSVYVEYADDTKFTVGNEIYKPSEFFTYELDEPANNNDIPVFTQDDMTVVKGVGVFKYKGTESDSIYYKLRDNVFTPLALMNSTGQTIYIYDGGYKATDKAYPKANDKIKMKNIDILYNHLSIKNATAYYVIANLFAMMDSFGKNMVLRTWDNGNMWWPCFYDMDSSNGLDNVGKETITPIEYVDNYENMGIYSYDIPTEYDAQNNLIAFRHFENIKTVRYRIPQNAQNIKYVGAYVNDPNIMNTVELTRNYYGCQYSCHNSGLWNMLRDDERYMWYNRDSEINYSNTWDKIRKNDFSSEKTFIQLLEEQMGNCGEMLYNMDYEHKYLNSLQGYPQMLHGTRKEYIENWMRQRIDFLDGVFRTKLLSSNYNDTVKMNAYASSKSILKVRTSTPAFLEIIFSKGEEEGTQNRYFIPANETTEIRVPIMSNPSQQEQFNYCNNITLLDGLDKWGFKTFTSELHDKLTSLMSFKMNGNAQFDGVNFAAIPTKSYIDNMGKTAYTSNLRDLYLRDINIVDTSRTTVVLYRVDKNNGNLSYDKINNIDISHSNITMLTIPQVPLSSLNVEYSNITDFNLSEQPILETLSFAGCKNLVSIKLINCTGLKEVIIPEGLTSLSSIFIENCPSIEKLSINGNGSKIKNITIDGVNNIKNISLVNCSDAETIRITNESTVPVIEHINIENVYAKTIVLPTIASIKNAEKIIFKDCPLASTISFGEPKHYLNDESKGFVLDISELENFDNFKLLNCPKVEYLKLPNIKESPIRLDSKNFKDSTGFRRIMGNLLLTSDCKELFTVCNNFYINEPFLDENSKFIQLTDSPNYRSANINAIYKPEVFFTDDETHSYTNIQFDSLLTDMTGMFASTQCSISDIYYILTRCKNVKNLNSTFANCENASIYPLDVNVFSQCPNVETINSIFNGTNIQGRFLDDTFLSYMPNLTRLDSILTHISINVNTCFFPKDTKIEYLKGFNPTAYDTSGGDDIAFLDSKVLRNLTKLKTIEDSFNGKTHECKIDFGTDNKCDLFEDLTNLEIIKDSFLKITGRGSLYNIFGGNEDRGKYSKKIKSVINSFVFDENSCHYTDDGSATESGVLMPIGNSFLKNITKSIKEICYDNTPYSNDSPEGGKCSFGGNIIKYIDIDDCCDGENFPYKIFEGCTELTEIPSFFYGLRFISEQENNVNISLPNNLFNGLGKLTNISHIFENMDTHYVVRLTSKGFKDCYLTDVSYSFRNINIKGMIPLKFFYMERNGIIQNTIIDMSSFFANNISTGITYYSVQNFEDLILPDSSNANHYVWNEYAYDGSFNFMETWIKNDEIIAEWGDKIDFESIPDMFKEEEKLVDPKIANEKYDDINSTGAGMGILVQRLFGVTNYFCPPDMFLYCDKSNTIVNSAFMYSGGYNEEASTGILRGIKGRIPTMLLQPIKNIVSLNSLFRGCISILPFSWGVKERDIMLGRVIFKPGMMFSPDLFKGMEYLQDVSHLFDAMRIWKGTKLPSELFNDCKELQTLSGLFYSAKWLWKDELYQQLPNDIFDNNNNITRIDSMLDSGNNGNSIYTISKDLFKNSIHVILSNVDSFMQSCAQTRGYVPEFWDDNTWPQIISHSKTYAGLDETLIKNYRNILDNYKN